MDYLKDICPSQLTVDKANKSDHLADYLDLTFIIYSGGKLSTRLYDKRDDFDSHIVNFPFLSSKHHLALLMVCTFHSSLDMYDAAHTMRISDIATSAWLIDRLLSQGYRALRLEKSFKKFYGRYQDLIEKYQRSVSVLVNDLFPG